MLNDEPMFSFREIDQTSRINDDLRFAVRAIKQADGEMAIFNLCRALGDDTEAAEIVRNEWRKS